MPSERAPKETESTPGRAGERSLSCSLQGTDCRQAVAHGGAARTRPQALRCAGAQSRQHAAAPPIAPGARLSYSAGAQRSFDREPPPPAH
eukprot:scaffold102144_cov24-Tisochrysis_lutea.AAC.2